VQPLPVLYYKATRHYIISCVCAIAETPRVQIFTKFGMDVNLANIITCEKCYGDRFTCFSCVGDQNSPFSIDLID